MNTSSMLSHTENALLSNSYTSDTVDCSSAANSDRRSFNLKCKLFEDALHSIDLQDFIVSSSNVSQNDEANVKLISISRDLDQMDSFLNDHS
jgi:hypothetical protein